MNQPINGSLWMFFLYDVCEEIRLDELRQLFCAQPAGREPSFRRPAPEYVRFQKPPVVESLPPIVLGEGQDLNARIHYYDYGVVSIAMELPFQCVWAELVELASRWIGSTELEKRALAVLEEQLLRARLALVDLYEKR